MIERAIRGLVSFKNKLKGIEDTPDVEIIGVDEDEDDCENDDEPLTWAEQKGVRRELRRYLLWHALRRKVPAAWEAHQ